VTRLPGGNLVQNKEKIIPHLSISTPSDHEIFLVLYMFGDDCQMGKGGRGGMTCPLFVLKLVLLFKKIDDCDQPSSAFDLTVVASSSCTLYC
jgi:hypothetical protein